MKDSYGATSMLTMDKPEMLQALEYDENKGIRERAGGEPPALRNLADNVLELHSKHPVNVVCRSKVLKVVQRWRGTSPEKMIPKRMREIYQDVWISGMLQTDEHIESLKRKHITSVLSLTPVQ